MAQFRVELVKMAPKYKNAFRRIPSNLFSQIDTSIRTWILNAKDETEIREAYKEAVAADLFNVRGYKIRSIAQIKK